MQLSLYGLSWYLMKLLDFSLTDCIAGLFCSVHKTLALGIPIVDAIFGKAADAAVYAIPIMMYHPFMIFIGSSLLSYFQDLVRHEYSQFAQSNAVGSESVVHIKNYSEHAEEQSANVECTSISEETFVTKQ
jgi:sodium/bile acid cotransporter 7